MVLSAYLLAVAVATSDLKQDQEVPKSCFEPESFINDLQKDDFTVIRVDDDIAQLYLMGLVQLGAPEPPGGIKSIKGVLFITTKKVPDKVMVSLINEAGFICHSTVIPLAVHNALLRGA